MTWGNEVYVVAAPILKIEHDSGKLGRSYFIKISREVTYIIILTKTAVQIAGGKKDCTRAVGTNEWLFFAKMG